MHSWSHIAQLSCATWLQVVLTSLAQNIVAGGPATPHPVLGEAVGGNGELGTSQTLRTELEYTKKKAFEREEELLKVIGMLRESLARHTYNDLSNPGRPSLDSKEVQTVNQEREDPVDVVFMSDIDILPELFDIWYFI